MKISKHDLFWMVVVVVALAFIAIQMMGGCQL